MFPERAQVGRRGADVGEVDRLLTAAFEQDGLMAARVSAGDASAHARRELDVSLDQCKLTRLDHGAKIVGEIRALELRQVG
jgi:hypothetical protein